MMTGIISMVGALVVSGTNLIYRSPALFKIAVVLEVLGIALLLIFWRVGK